MVGSKPCRAILLEVPATWLVYVVALESRASASGRHPVKKCTRCGGWAELRGNMPVPA